MATDDRCCTIVPYFKIHPGKLDAVRSLCEQFIEQSRNEPTCLYYRFSFDGDQVHCREAIRMPTAPWLTWKMSALCWASY